MGILILVLFAICTIGALLFAKVLKFNASLLCILVLGLSLRVFMSLDGFLHPWDERYHALVAKNMIEEPTKPMLLKNPHENYNFRNWTDNHVWLHKPPLSLWMIAGSLKLFGIHEFNVRIPSILFSTLSIWLIFILGKRLFNVETGLIAAYFFSINGFLLDQSSGRAASDHIDTAFLFFSLLCTVVILSAKRTGYNKYIIGGLLFGLALLTKSLIAGLLPLIAVTANYNNLVLRKYKLVSIRLILFIGLGAVLYVPWQLYVQDAFPLEAQFESQYNLLHLTKALENHDEPWHYYITILRLFYNEIIYLPLLFLIYQTIAQFDQKKLTMVTWIFVPIIVFSVSATKMPGYLNIAAPAIFVVLGWFMVEVMKRIPKKSISIGLLVLVGLLSIRFSIENLDPFISEDERQPEWSKKIKQGEFVEDHKIEYLFYNEP